MTILITPKQRETLIALFDRHLPNTSAWAYGSRVKGSSKPSSDLDVVVFTRPDQRGHVSALREALDESSLPFRVDLFEWDEIPENFRASIEQEHVVFVETDVRSMR